MGVRRCHRIVSDLRVPESFLAGADAGNGRHVLEHVLVLFKSANTTLVRPEAEGAATHALPLFDDRVRDLVRSNRPCWSRDDAGCGGQLATQGVRLLVERESGLGQDVGEVCCLVGDGVVLDGEQRVEFEDDDAAVVGCILLAAIATSVPMLSGVSSCKTFVRSATVTLRSGTSSRVSMTRCRMLVCESCPRNCVLVVGLGSHASHITSWYCGSLLSSLATRPSPLPRSRIRTGQPCGMVRSALTSWFVCRSGCGRRLAGLGLVVNAARSSW